MFILFRSSILISLSMFLTGCASTQMLSPQQKQQLHSVAVNEKVSYPTHVYYVGPGVGLLAAGGLVGGAVMGGVSVHQGAELTQFVNKSHIDITQIVKDQMISEINQKTKLKIAKQNADADLNISISLYGFSAPTAYNASVVPVLGVNAELVRNNQIIWKNHYFVDCLFGGMKSYSSTEVFGDPAKVRAAWTAAAHKAAQEMIKTLS